jgi:hypothetical protein
LTFFIPVYYIINIITGGAMMNKYALCACVIALSLIFPPLLNAVEISVGAASWYVTWERKILGDTVTKQEMGPELMYGPLAAWQLSGIPFNITHS